MLVTRPAKGTCSALRAVSACISGGHGWGWGGVIIHLHQVSDISKLVSLCSSFPFWDEFSVQACKSEDFTKGDDPLHM